MFNSPAHRFARSPAVLHSANSLTAAPRGPEEVHYVNPTPNARPIRPSPAFAQRTVSHRPFSRRTSHAARGTSHVARRTSHVARGRWHVARRTWHVARGTSHVARRTSHAARGTSHVA